MKLKKYITAAVIVLAVAVIVGLNTVTRENMASSPVLITQAGEGGYIDFKVPQGGKIKEILFSSYGTPFIGGDGKPKRGNCHADTWIKRECEGKSPPACTGIRAHNHWWSDPCPGYGKKLLVSYTVTDPAAEAKAREEEEKAATAKAIADAVAKAQADAAAKAQADAAAKAQADAAAKAQADAAAAANRTTGTAPSTTASTPVVSTPTRISEEKSTSTPPSAAASTPAPAASTASTPAPAAASTAAPAASTPAAAAVSTGRTSKGDTDNTMMYVALGIGAVVLLLGVFMISSRRQPAPVMAGRRR